MAEAYEVYEQVSNHPSICLLEDVQPAVYPALPCPHRSSTASDLFMHNLAFLSLVWHFNFAFYLLATAGRINSKCSSTLQCTWQPSLPALSLAPWALQGDSKVFFLLCFPLVSTRSCISGKQAHFLAAFMAWKGGSSVGLTLSITLENEIKWN